MGPAWRNNGMSMRNPMSRAPMNNNPMGAQSPTQPNFAPNVSFQRAAQNVLMQQPPGANTAMRPLSMPGMQFDANQNAMAPTPRSPLTPNPNSQQWGNLSGGSLTRSDDQRWSRMARQAGVRPQDMQAWRTRKIAEGGGIPGRQPIPGGEFVGPVIPNGQRMQAGAQMGPAAQQPAAPVAAVVRPAPVEQARGNMLQRVVGGPVGAWGPGAGPIDGGLAGVFGKAQQATEQRQLQRFKSLDQGVPQAPELPVAIGRLSALNQPGPDPIDSLAAKWRNRRQGWNGFDQAQAPARVWRGWGS